MSTRIVIIGVFLTIWCQVGFAIIINVPGDYPTIQQGIDASIDGDTVLVASGIYADSAVTDVLVEHEHASFLLNSNLMVIEVYEVVSQTSGLIDPSEYYWFSRPGYCGISFPYTFEYNGHLLDISFRILSVYPERPVIHVSIVLMGESPTTTRIYGGGEQPIVNITADNVVVEGFTIFEGNGWGDVSGIYADSRAGLAIRNNIISDMNGWGDVSGIRAESCTGLTISNNIIYETGGWGDVSAIRLISCSGSHIHNNTLFELGSWQIGAAIRLDDCVETSVINNIADEIMWGGGYGIYCTGTSSPAISYNCFHGCGYGGCNPGQGDISLDPLFVSVERMDWDFHLQSLQGSYHSGEWLPDPRHSPCIDTGDPTFSFDNEPEPNGNLINMGAYGNTDEASLSSSGPIATFREVPLPLTHALYPNFPNPFNPITTIRYDVKQTGQVLLTIFNLLGQEVATLADGMRLPGSYTTVWNATGLPSGIYLCRMEVVGFVYTRKLVLVK